MIRTKLFLFVFWILFATQIVNTQVNITYYKTPNNKNLLLFSLIDDIPYFIRNESSITPETELNEGQIWKFENSEFTQKLILNSINDTLNQLALFDIWKNNGKFSIFGLCKSSISGRTYAYTATIDLPFGQIENLDLISFGGFRSNFGFYPILTNHKREWFLLEFDNITNKVSSIFRLSVVNTEIKWNRLDIPESFDIFQISDIHYFYDRDLIVISVQGFEYQHYVVYDLDWNLLFYDNPPFIINGVLRSRHDNFLVGNIGDNIQTLHRLREGDKSVLYKGELNKGSDSFHFLDNFTPMNTDDDISLVRKHQHDTLTILHYSKSFLGAPNNLFGFDILFYDRTGSLVEQFVIKESQATGINNLFINPDTRKGFGSGRWFDQGQTVNFIFEISLSDTTTSTEDIWQEEAPSLLLSNLIVDGQLRFIHSEINLNRITVYDISGRQLISGLSTNSDISFLPAGHYVVRYDGESGVITERFVMVE